MLCRFLLFSVVLSPVWLNAQAPTAIINTWAENAFISQNGAIIFEIDHPSPEILVSPAKMNFQPDSTLTVSNWRWCPGEPVTNGSVGKWEITKNNETKILTITLTNHSCIQRFKIVELAIDKLVLEPIQ